MVAKFIFFQVESIYYVTQPDPTLPMLPKEQWPGRVAESGSINGLANAGALIS